VPEQARPEVVADPVVRVVAQERSRGQREEEIVNVRIAGRGQRAGDEEQRISGQERRHHQAGLAEDDREQDGVDPRAILRDQRLEMGVEVKDQVEEAGEELHAISL